MKSKYDDFWDDYCKEIEPAAPPTNEINMNKLGEQMEKAVSNAFKKAEQNHQEQNGAEPEQKEQNGAEPEQKETDVNADVNNENKED